MKILIAVMALALAASVGAYEPRVDGSWFDGGCFGCPGDKVINEVIQQGADYDEANEALAGDRSFETLEECLRLAPFSFLKAGHALELADRHRIAGDKAVAQTWYTETLRLCTIAKAMPLNPDFLGRKGNNIPKQSHKEAALYEKLANEGQAKLK